METLLLDFSGRSDGGNGKKVMEYINSRLNSACKMLRICDMNIHPCNQCGYECLKNTPCKYADDDIKYLYDEILSSDQIFFLIPVYADYPCSNYFVFHERAQSYFFNEDIYRKYLKKNIRFIILANNGFENVLRVLEDDFGQINIQNMLQLSSGEYHAKSVDGDLITYDAVQTKIKNWLSMLRNDH